MKKKVTIAAYLAGVTTLAVSLPAMADTTVSKPLLADKPGLEQAADVKTETAG